MYPIELLFFALALSMDAFAVAICIGLVMPQFNAKKALVVGLYFGLFQAAMPLIGYWAGGVFAERITAFDHWIAFVLLAFLGGKMIWGSLKISTDSKIESVENSVDTKIESTETASVAPLVMLPLAFATSVDALAAGVSFAFMRVSILPAVIFIGVATFAISAIGVKLGGIVGEKFKSKAEFAGGVVLVLLGVFNLVQGL